VTTQRFLKVFALGSLRDLPDLDTLDNAGARERDDSVEAALDDALGLMEEEGAAAEDSLLHETEAEA
jgi:segregation and condensation protein B